MASEESEETDGTTGPAARPALEPTAETGLKIVVVGGFGVGKTTLVRSVSEIRPLNTEETLTRAGAEVDDLTGVKAKSETTVAFDFGRISLGPRHVLYLFGAPGQPRFWFLWDQLFEGALGAVVLVDTRRVDDCWYAVDRLEQIGTPFIVARNDFGGPPYTPAELREALDLDPDVPVIDCDARSRESAARVLITLVEHLTTRSGPAARPRPDAPDASSAPNAPGAPDGTPR
ncbi:GTP-binding protein [Streptomyces sp. JNUCC 64]